MNSAYDESINSPDFLGIIIMAQKDIQIIQRERLFVKWWPLVILMKANVKIFWTVNRHSAHRKNIFFCKFLNYSFDNSLPNIIIDMEYSWLLFDLKKQRFVIFFFELVWNTPSLFATAFKMDVWVINMFYLFFNFIRYS